MRQEVNGFSSQYTIEMQGLSGELRPIITSFEQTLIREGIPKRNEKFYPLVLEAINSLKQADSLFSLKGRADSIGIHYFKDRHSFEQSIDIAFRAVQSFATFYLSPATSNKNIVAVLIAGAVHAVKQADEGATIISSPMPDVTQQQYQDAKKELSKIVNRYNSTQKGRQNPISKTADLDDPRDLRSIEDTIFSWIDYGCKNDQYAEKRLGLLQNVISLFDTIRRYHLANQMFEDLQQVSLNR